MTRALLLLPLAGLALTADARAAASAASPAAIAPSVLGNACFSWGASALPPFVVPLSAPVPKLSRIVVAVMRWGNLPPTVVGDTQDNVYLRDYAAALFEVYSAHVRQPLGVGDAVTVGLAEPAAGVTWKFCASVLRVDGVAAVDALDRSAAAEGSVFSAAIPFVVGPTAPTREPGEWRLAVSAHTFDYQGSLWPDPPYALVSASVTAGLLPLVSHRTLTGGVAPAGPQTFTGLADVTGPLHHQSMSWWAALLTYRPWRPGARGDFDGDGATDLLIEDAAGAVSVWMMSGATRLQALPVVPAIPSGWHVAAADDFDGDGRADLVLRQASSGALEFWLMDGAQSQAVVALTTPIPAGYALAGSGDLTGDGRADLLWIDAATGRLAVWAMGADGGPRTEPSYEIDVAAPLPAWPWQFGAIADLTGDGLLDLAWRNAVSGQVVVWRMGEKAERLSGGYVTPAGPAGADWSLVGAAERGFGSAAGVALSTDLLWHNSATGALSVGYLNPSGPPYPLTALGSTQPAALPVGARVVGPR